jgi:hypothetical protein
VQSLVNLLGGVWIFYCFWQNPWNFAIFRAWILSSQGYFLYLDVLSAHQWSSNHLWNCSEATTCQIEVDGRQEIWLKCKLYCYKNNKRSISWWAFWENDTTTCLFHSINCFIVLCTFLLLSNCRIFGWFLKGSWSLWSSLFEKVLFS